MADYTVQNGKKKTVFEADDLESCLEFCRSRPSPLRVYKGETLLAYKKGGSSSRRVPHKDLDSLE